MPADADRGLLGLGRSYRERLGMLRGGIKKVSDGLLPEEPGREYCSPALVCSGEAGPAELTSPRFRPALRLLLMIGSKSLGDDGAERETQQQLNG